VHRLTRRVARIIASNALIAMRGMKHAQRDRNKLDEARQRRTRREATTVWSQVTFRDRSSVCYAPGIGTHAAARHTLQYYPYPFCNCRSQQLFLSPDDAASKNMRLTVGGFSGDLIVERRNVCK
jgi:hypothetical protein